MGHLIEEIKIKNFKSCNDTTLFLSDYTPLVGYNNAGKSNCLAAINWLLKKKTLDISFFNNPTQPIIVEADIVGISTALLGQMTTAHANSISPYLYGVNNNKLTIKREQASPTSTATSIKIHVWDNSASQWASNPTGIDNALKAILPEPIRIGAMENAAEDASKAKNTTTIGKLLANITQQVQAAHANQIKTHLDNISSLIASDGSTRLSQLSTIDQSLNSKIQDLFPDIRVKLHFPTPTEEELLTSGTIKVLESNSTDERDFSSYGHGAQRSIQMGLVRHLADVSNPHGITTKLLLIDEPELYLHPFGIEQVREALISLSENGYQVIFSTHSANMITAEEAPKTLLIRKDASNCTYSRLRLSDAIQTVVSDSTHQMEQLFSLSHSSHILFSEKVILTEGKTELRLLPYIYKVIKNRAMGIDKYALVAQSGVGDTKKSMAILNAMDLPAKAICDLDFITRAIKNGFLPQNDPDVAAIKTIFQQIAGTHGMNLTNQHWPQNTQAISAAQCFEKLAIEPSAIPHIQNIHDNLKSQGIWLWKLGAIEVYLGLTGKDEAHWAQFKTDVQANGINNVCANYQELADFINWL
ncbi:AAA family ATPase [Vibrio coralliilyticus]|uniref:ATP-dependent OLD family endonuclease n=1 Tax=Vibrio coralliilyticus TaxID=190893 RepID=A0AAN0SEN3_9VIBR|nr:AAA family ATPase [Vibrio coralliilyticus]AIW21042.1 ATP-dependent OLD family endonuclease [Vibrio coralliilyticus]NOH40046.1 AAA family ATPase [Vibrio coralliilyticus]